MRLAKLSLALGLESLGKEDNIFTWSKGNHSHI